MFAYHRWQTRVAAACVATGLATAASAVTLEITVTNNQGAGGFAITPLYLGFHDGSFDAFNVGEAASTGVELIAETGIPSIGGTVGTPVEGTTGVAQERLAVDPDSMGAVIASPVGPPPIEPGESITIETTINSTDDIFLTYLSMLVPSNDTFLGNDDPMEHLLLDDGVFVGPTIIQVTGADLFDAGTEENALFGSAFTAGQSTFEGTPTIGGVITGQPDLTFLTGVATATGAVLGPDEALDFFTDPDAFSLLTIEIREVPAPIPLPASGWLLVAGLGAVAAAKRRRKAG